MQAGLTEASVDQKPRELYSPTGLNGHHVPKSKIKKKADVRVRFQPVALRCQEPVQIQITIVSAAWLGFEIHKLNIEDQSRVGWNDSSEVTFTCSRDNRK
jgi:hypothetical protein